MLTQATYNMIIIVKTFEISSIFQSFSPKRVKKLSDGNQKDSVWLKRVASVNLCNVQSIWRPTWGNKSHINWQNSWPSWHSSIFRKKNMEKTSDNNRNSVCDRTECSCSACEKLGHCGALHAEINGLWLKWQLSSNGPKFVWYLSFFYHTENCQKIMGPQPKISDFGRKASACLLKLHFMCPEKHFGGLFFEKKQLYFFSDF